MHSIIHNYALISPQCLFPQIRKGSLQKEKTNTGFHCSACASYNKKYFKILQISE